MIRFIIILFFVLFPHLVYSQTENKDVTITASGSGATQEDAKQTALRSAIEQAYGAFISTKTEMLNDQVVADEMTSVSAGNIKSYEILSQDSLPNGRWGLTLKAVVSIDKLTSFVEAKGGTVEIKAELFALNIKQQALNEQGEVQAVAEMVGLLHEPMQTAFDYSIKSGEPKSLDAENKNWEIPLEVTATCNKNMEFCANYFIKTLKALSLSESEVETYKSLNKKVFSVSINFGGNNNILHLRRKHSIEALNSLISNWEYYVRLFSVKSSLLDTFGIGNGKIHKLTINNSYDYNKLLNEGIFLSVSFLTKGEIAGVFTWNDKLTLRQIEEMSGYSVRPRGVISEFKYGGYIVLNSGQGFRLGIATVADQFNFILKGGPADLAGIKVGDKIIMVNGTAYSGNSSQIANAISNGLEVNFILERQGKKIKKDVSPKLMTWKGLVVSICDLPEPFDSGDSITPKAACEKLDLNGYHDWHVPNIQELNMINQVFFTKGLNIGLKPNNDIRTFEDNECYISSSIGSDWQVGTKPLLFNFSLGKKFLPIYSCKVRLRPVRVF